MAKLLDWIFGRHYDSTTPRTMPPVGSTRELQPISPTTAPKTDDLPPLKNWCHPFKDTRDPLQQLTHLANAAAGYYPLGRNGLWHGGVHFDSGTALGLKQSSMHCLADGEVVAYRIDTYSPTTTYFDNEEVEKPFSRNFVLIRHHLQPPAIQDSKETPPSLIFYSLYMHLQDREKYDEDPTLARPGFWPEVHRVKATANDPHPDDPEQRGVYVYYRPWSDKVADFLPRGAEVIISGDGEYRRLENRMGPTSLSNADGSLRGYLASQFLQSVVDGQHRIETARGALKVRREASLHSKEISELPKGTIVTVSGKGEFCKLERVTQLVQFAALQSVLEPLATDRIVVLDTPVAIKAGDLIGHVGLYQDGGASQPEKKLHLETFSGDDVEAFIDASRVWADRLPEKDRTWLKLAKGTPVVPPESNNTAAKLQMASASSPLSAADLLVPKKLLDDLPTDRKIQVPATPTREAHTWYRLANLLHDANNKPLDGWVCEEPGVTPWVSPWAWEGYDVIIDYSRPKHLMASFLSAVDRFTEAQRERYRPIAEKDDKGPMKSRLYEIIDRNRDGKLTATELQAALELPAHAQSISQMILYKESEWFHQPKIWDALDDLLGHSGSTPHLNWLAEKQRIAEMGWWKEVAEQVGLPSWGSAYHFHPIGLMGIFSCNRFKFTLEVMKRIYPELSESRYGDLQKIADELNGNIDFFKLDTPLRRTHFFAQIKQETGEDLSIDEKFVYEAGALIDLFSYFKNNPEEAMRYGYKTKAGKIKESGLPMTRSDYEAIANGAYGGRTDLGNRGISSGDGWKYRGRGLKQLTGLHNYTAFQRWHSAFSTHWPNEKIDFVANPELLIEMKYAVRSAASFWLSNKLYEVADKGSAPEIVDLITAVVNKHTKSHSDRRSHFRKLWSYEVLE
ncbi:glycoside hydrolase family 19 protein [Pseudomonas sp. MHK4]